MTKKDLILTNFNETRRRSIMAWEGLPEDHCHWKPDATAMTALQVIRHVLQADYGWNIIISRGDMSNYTTPWENKPLVSVKDELEFAAPYRQAFLETVHQFSENDLSEIVIIHPGNGTKKILGDYLLRIGYHESVHTGQFLAYLRTINVDRPMIWD